MSSPSLLCSTIQKNVKQLSDSLGFLGDREIKQALEKAKEILKNNENTPEKVDLSAISRPFIIANYKNVSKYQPIAFDYFSTLFQFSCDDLCPSKELTEESIDLLFKIDVNTTDELKMKCCKAVNNIINSVSGGMYIHGINLYSLVTYLVLLYNDSVTSEHVSEIIRMTMKLIVSKSTYEYGKQAKLPKCEKCKEIAQLVIDNLIENSLSILQYLPMPNYTANIHDVDIVSILHAFTKAIEVHKFHSQTLILTLDTMTFILKQNISLFKKPFFNKILLTDIHVTLMAAILNSNYELAHSTTDTLVAVWQRHSTNYLIGLNDILNKAILTSLQSKEEKATLKAMKVIRCLSKQPRFFVDCFVNYDCDASGDFKNIFRESFNQLSILSASENQEISSAALKTIAVVTERLDFYTVSQPKEPIQLDNLMNAKKSKDLFDTCLDTFSEDPLEGLKQLQESGFIDGTFGLYVYKNPQLDKKAVGELLGGSRPENEQVLCEFIDEFAFEGAKFEDAFRMFLARLELPSSQSSVDRILKMFSVKYFEDNRTLFSCADPVYLLAFEALKLDADLHDESIGEHATVDSFIRACRGIDQGKDLPEMFLEDLFRGIAAVPLASSRQGGLLKSDQKAEAYKEASKKTIEDARRKVLHTGKFARTDNPMLVGPMYSTVAMIIADMVEKVTHNSENPAVLTASSRVLISALSICCDCYLEEPLIRVCNTIIDYINYQREPTSSRNLLGALVQNAGRVRCVWREILTLLMKLSVLTDESMAADRLVAIGEGVFENATVFETDLLADFLRVLTALSAEDLKQNPPRTYFLDKVGKIVLENVDRPKAEWRIIWGAVSPHYVAAARVGGEARSIALEMLEQIPAAFLKGASDGLHFEREALGPLFELSAGDDLSLKEEAFRMVSGLVEGRAAALFSGWEVVFQVLMAAATERDSRLEGAFDLLEKCIVNHLGYAGPYVMHILPVLTQFVRLEEPEEIPLRGVPLFRLLLPLMTDADAWVGFFEALCGCGEHRSETVRALAAGTVYGILEEEELPEAALEYLFTRGLPMVADEKIVRWGLHPAAGREDLARQFAEELLKKYIFVEEVKEFFS